MNLERQVCELVRLHWNDLHPDISKPGPLVFLKVQGKTSPNAAIIGLILDENSRCPVAVSKIPRNPLLAPGMQHEYAAMVNLRNSITKKTILDKITCNGSMAEVDGISILLQAAGNGHPMVREMISRKAIEELYGKIIPWMFEFHTDGMEDCLIEGDVLHDLVEKPIACFLEASSFLLGDTLSSRATQYLVDLPQKVKGKKVRLCRQHGDFNAHNVLVTFNKNRLIDFTLIDWEDYKQRQLPVFDLNHFFTSNSKLVGTGLSAEESYNQLILREGWYRGLYRNAVAAYEGSGVISSSLFWALTPIYFISMCLSMTEIQRDQKNTVNTWARRLNAFIDRYSGGLE